MNCVLCAISGYEKWAKCLKLLYPNFPSVFILSKRTESTSIRIILLIVYNCFPQMGRRLWSTALCYCFLILLNDAVFCLSCSSSICLPPRKLEIHLLIKCLFYFPWGQCIVEFLSQDLPFLSPLSRPPVHIPCVFWSNNHPIWLRSDGHGSLITLYASFLAPPHQEDINKLDGFQRTARKKKMIKEMEAADLWEKMKRAKSE